MAIQAKDITLLDLYYSKSAWKTIEGKIPIRVQVWGKEIYRKDNIGVFKKGQQALYSIFE